MKRLSFKHTYLLSLVLCVVACSFHPKGEHWKIYFANNSQDTILVFDYWFHNLNRPEPEYRSGRGFHWPEYCYLVAPGTVNSDVFPGLGYMESYETLFEVIDSLIIYVLPKDYNGIAFHCDAKIVSYYLTLEDLVSLDYHLYYPPNEIMSGVKMDPPYETFVSND